MPKIEKKFNLFKYFSKKNKLINTFYNLTFSSKNINNQRTGD